MNWVSDNDLMKELNRYLPGIRKAPQGTPFDDFVEGIEGLLDVQIMLEKHPGGIEEYSLKKDSNEIRFRIQNDIIIDFSKKGPNPDTLGLELLGCFKQESERLGAKVRKKVVKRWALIDTLVPQEVMLIKESAPTAEKAFEIFKLAVGHGRPAILITRVHPNKIRWNYKLPPHAKIYWLAREKAEGEERLPPENLNVISHEIKEFLAKESKGVVVVDGIDYLVTRHKFSMVLDLVGRLQDAASLSDGCTVILSVNEGAFNLKEMGYLEDEAIPVEEDELKE
jgi:hypothetical protein